MGNIMRLTGVISIICPLSIYIVLSLLNIHNRYFSDKSRINKFWKASLVLYFLIIVYMTIIRKLPPGIERQLNLHLFWSYDRWRAADIRWQVYMNVFLFIPFGFLLRKRFVGTLLIVLAISTCIDLTQYIFRLGLCELDDIFHNTLGAMIGCGYYKILDTLWKKTKKK